jgi:predicted Zn-dependent protease
MEENNCQLKRIAAAVIAVMLFASCGSVPLTGRKQLLLVSNADVLATAATSYSEYIQTAPQSTAATQTAMVNRVAARIAAAAEEYMRQNGLESELSNFQWEFNLIAENTVNAFCMPGGKIVVYEGILQLMAVDDELAVVLGHEVAHAIAKHSNERMSQQLVNALGQVALTVALDKQSDEVKELSMLVFGLGAEYGVMLPFSRKHELEADYMGLVFMTMAGYDPKKAVPFWQKMQEASGGSSFDFLSTHPAEKKRIQKIIGYLPDMEKYKNQKITPLTVSASASASAAGGKTGKTDGMTVTNVAAVSKTNAAATGKTEKLDATTWSGEATFSGSNIVTLFDLTFIDGKSCTLKSAMKGVADGSSLTRGTYKINGSTVTLDFGEELDGMQFTLKGNQLISESGDAKIVLKKKN